MAYLISGIFKFLFWTFPKMLFFNKFSIAFILVSQPLWWSPNFLLWTKDMHAKSMQQKLYKTKGVYGEKDAGVVIKQHYKIGANCFKNQKYSDAIAYLENAVAISEKFEQNSNLIHDIKRCLGDAYYHLGKPDKAIACYHTIAEDLKNNSSTDLGPITQEIQYKLGLAKWVSNDSEGAIGYFKTCLRDDGAIDPIDLNARYYLSVIYRKQGKNLDAEEIFDPVLNVYSAKYTKGEITSFLGQYIGESGEKAYPGFTKYFIAVI